MSKTVGTFTANLILNGDTLTASLEATKDLWQGISADAGVIAPDWSVAANQPVISPRVFSTKSGAAISVIDGSQEWSYNTQKLIFNASGVCTSPSNCVGKFKQLPNGSLQIISNLASATNKNADNIKFEGVVNAGNYESRISATADIRIEQVNASSYTGLVDMLTATIVTSTDVITVKTRLMNGLTEMNPASYNCSWWKSIPAAQDTDGVVDGWVRFKPEADKQLTIGAVDVDSQEVFKCEFIVEAKIVATALFTITDTQDPAVIDFTPASWDCTELNTSQVVVVKLTRRDTGAEVVNPAFVFQAYNSMGVAMTLETAMTSNSFTVKRTDMTAKLSGSDKINGSIKVTATATY